jgi:hypothetical protein
MNCLSHRLLRCLAFGFLFFVAATADLMATSCFTDGHHANNPLLRIEHKCVAVNKQLTSEKHYIIHSITPANNVIAHNEGTLLTEDTVSCLSSFTHLPLLTPLRC